MIYGVPAASTRVDIPDSRSLTFATVSVRAEGRWPEEPRLTLFRLLSRAPQAVTPYSRAHAWSLSR